MIPKFRVYDKTLKLMLTVTALFPEENYVEAYIDKNVQAEIEKTSAELKGESVNNLIPSELVKLDVDLRESRGQMTKDFMLQIKLRKLIERRIFLIKELKNGMMQRMFV